MNELDISAWTSSWMWGLPLIIVTALSHTIGLGLINHAVTRVMSGVGKSRAPQFLAALGMMSAAVFSVTLLHGVEALVWSEAFVLVGALPNTRLAMLYSLGAMTTYGHAPTYLAPHWQFMGALEALNGMILFGLTTAFLFTVIQQVWPHVTRA